MSKYKLIAMDLDGTLTQHKTKIEDMNLELLDSLSKNYRLVLVGAGSCKRIFEQMREYPIDIIGQYGLQQSTVDETGWHLIKNFEYSIDKMYFIDVIKEIRENTGYSEYYGDSVEFHKSGVVTFPLLGTSANSSDKLKFDPDRKKRSLIYDYVSSFFKEYNCFIGGSSSFDIVKKGYDKLNSLLNYSEGICSRDEILYLGDDFQKGGNDESVFLGGIDCINVSDYRSISQLLFQRGVL